MKDTKTCAIFDLDGTIIRLSSEQVFLRYLLSHGEIPIPNLLAWVSYLLRVKSLRAAKPNKIYLRGLEQTHVHEIARRCFTETLRPSIAPHISELIHRHRAEERDSYPHVGFVVFSRSAVSCTLPDRSNGRTPTGDG